MEAAQLKSFKRSKGLRVARGAIWFLEEFARRAKRNPSYSIRAFARDLGISRTIVSDVMAQKRSISRRNGIKVAHRLGLSPAETLKFLDRVGVSGSSTGQWPDLIYQEDRFRLISEWYYVAILNLADCKDALADSKEVAERLGLSEPTARKALLRLKRLGLLTIQDGKLVRTCSTFGTTDNLPSESIRHFHGGLLDQAAQALSRVDVDRRHFEANVVPVPAAALPALKALIREFTDQFTEALGQNGGQGADDVYSLAIQLFPLTQRSRRQQ